jgi:hypothetical protein
MQEYLREIQLDKKGSAVFVTAFKMKENNYLTKVRATKCVKALIFYLSNFSKIICQKILQNYKCLEYNENYIFLQGVWLK